LPFGLRDGGGHDEAALGAFPTLFRRQDDPTVDTDTAEEHTSVSIMADAERARRHEAEVDGDGDDGPAVRDGDTQIMLVIRQDGGGAPGAAPASGHRLKEEQGYNLRETLNLREYQASMGMSESAARPADDAAELEEEDADLIVMTRREVEPGASPAAPTPARPVEVVHKPIVPLAPPPVLPIPPAPGLSPAPTPSPTPATMASRAPPPSSRPSPSGSPTPPPRRAPKGGPKAAVAPAGEATPTVRLLPGLILVALLMAALGLALVLLIARLTG
jgi:hypothetical protein